MVECHVRYSTTLHMETTANQLKIHRQPKRFSLEKKGGLEIDKIYNGDCFSLINQLEDNSVDLIICDGPYGITNNDWDRISNIQDFNLEIIKTFSRVLKDGGSFYLFGKHNCIDFIDYRPYLNLMTKIIWYQPSRLAQGRKNYTNNYDIIAYFTKGRSKTFDLNAIRIPQLVELEHRRRCENVPSVTSGKFHKTRFHPDGKNPGDVWGDIKQLTYKSKELLNRDFLNTIQKPLKLMERMIKASSQKGDLILDPFAGVGTSLVAAKRLERNFIGFELNADFVRIINERLDKEDEVKSYQLPL